MTPEHLTTFAGYFQTAMEMDDQACGELGLPLGGTAEGQEGAAQAREP
jgi:hypothetical protein